MAIPDPMHQRQVDAVATLMEKRYIKWRPFNAMLVELNAKEPFYRALDLQLEIYKRQSLRGTPQRTQGVQNDGLAF